ncbi:hypothetical protein [Mesorhizobium sp.]|uniref:hypothetical protein n=1 Tax=Mesorhizobium sp. TaxID=1871066 RepID=UPI000FE3F916|nr:hypothetical protein [Mesorhizobium sp.]RWN90232.1 MAG: hypothetical protein EOS06_33605 [Mesorhizobium sp.]
MGEEEKSDRDRMTDFQAQFLAKEAGITEAQARELIKLIGHRSGITTSGSSATEKPAEAALRAFTMLSIWDNFE